jgi:hypothetical protein
MNSSFHTTENERDGQDEPFVHLSYLCTEPLKVTYPTGDQLQHHFRRWLSPPDPSTNHNIARKAYHSGTATWFIEGNTFRQWKSTGSLLWIHGKRALHLLTVLTASSDCDGLKIL